MPFLRRAGAHDPGQQALGIGFVEQPCQQRERFAPGGQVQPQFQEAPGAARIPPPGVEQAHGHQILAQGHVAEEVAVGVRLAQPRQQSGLFAQAVQQVGGGVVIGSQARAAERSLQGGCAGVAAGVHVPCQRLERCQIVLFVLRRRAALPGALPGFLHPLPVQVGATAGDRAGCGVVLGAQAQQQRVVEQAAQGGACLHLLDQGLCFLLNLRLPFGLQRPQPSLQVGQRFLPGICEGFERVFLQPAQGEKPGRARGQDDPTDPAAGGPLDPLTHQLAHLRRHLVQPIEQDDQTGRLVPCVEQPISIFLLTL
jgi:hypothetical protein